MDEKKEIESQDKEKVEAEAEATPAEDGGEKEDKIPQVEEAKQAAADIKIENDRKEKLIEREEKLQDRKESIKALGGESPAGSREEKPQEETPEEFSKRIQKGEVPMDEILK